MTRLLTTGVFILPAIYVICILLFALSEDSDGWVSVIEIFSYLIFFVMTKPVLFITEWIFKIIDIENQTNFNIGFGFVFWLVVGWILDQYINYIFKKSEKLNNKDNGVRLELIYNF